MQSEPLPPSAHGVPFFDAAERARAEDDSALERLLGPAQLMGAPPKDAGPEWSFETRVMPPTFKYGMDLRDALLFPVRKQHGKLFANTILVGRAESCDIVLSHPSISKLHARIKRGPDGLYSISDAGSTNGTWVASCLLSTSEVPLPWGAHVQFGDWRLRFFPLADTLSKLRS
jgi:hypothetical protein